MASTKSTNANNLVANLLEGIDSQVDSSNFDSTLEAIQAAAADPDLLSASFNGATFDAGVAISVDTVTAAGLKDLGNVNLDAEATISATSTAKSTANATDVSDDSASLAFVDGNFGLIGAELIDVNSNAGLSATAATTISASASTSKGDAVSFASLQDSAGIQGVTDLDVGGELTALGKAVNTITATAETVVDDTSDADYGNGAQATAELSGIQQGFDATNIDASSNASVQGLTSLVNSATASVTTGDLALAEGLANTLIGANINGIDVGGIATVTGQATFGNTSKASNVEGDSRANSYLDTADGLKSLDNHADNGTAAFEVSSDATIKGLTSVTAAATAETTKGDAEASTSADNINGADFQGLLDIGGVGSITGAANFNLSATASSVSTADNNDALGGATAESGNSVQSFGLHGINGDAVPGGQDSDPFGIDVASNATLSGTAIGSLKADASSTADDAFAKAGLSAELTGANIGDLHVGGIANLTGAAQLTGNASAVNVGANDYDATAQAGLDATVTGLSGLPTGTSGALQSFIDVASDATVTAQAFGTLNATATSTGGDATANAGDIGSVLTGLASGLDLDIGGVGSLSALAQGSENASATSVDGIATSTAGMTLMGAEDLRFDTSSDGTLSGIAKLAATIDASSTGTTASASGEFSAIGLDQIDIGSVIKTAGVITDGTDGIGGVSTLKGQAQIAGTLNAESVAGNAFAGVNDPHSIITGLNDVVLNGASDGTVLGTASGVFNTNATNIGGSGLNASAASYQDLRGISTLDLNLGGNGGINAIVNDTNFVGAHSVSGNATAVASVDAIGLAGGDLHIAGNASILSTVGVDSKSESSTVG